MTISLFCGGCGKRRPPTPPVRSANFQLQLAATQKGANVLLKIPLNNLSNISSYQQIDVYRLAETANSPSFLNEEEFAARSTVVGSLPLSPSLASNDAVNFQDALSLSSGSVRLRYAVRFINKDGQKSAFSNFALFETTANVAQAPRLTNFEPTQQAIALDWQVPTKNLDGSSPPNLAGYNVYRRSNDKTVRLNSTLVTETNFEDRVFQFGNEYSYTVRAVSTAVNGSQIESDDSNEIKVAARDTFPPSPPDGLTIAAAPGRLSLFFAANPESDVRGYLIYRSRDENLSKEKWERLNEQPLDATTFQDEKVETGVKYFYFVRAIDSVGNLSAPSAVVTEVAP